MLDHKLSNIVKVQTSRPRFYKNDILLITIFLGFIFGVALHSFLSPNYYHANSPIRFNVQKGSTFNSVVDSLFEKRIIPHKYMMKLTAFICNADDAVQAGTYTVPNGLSYYQLMKLLIRGASDEQVLVTIPEGIWNFKLAGLLSRELGIDSLRFMELSRDQSFLHRLGINQNSLEGYILPDSYYFVKNVSVEDVIKRLKQQMDLIFKSPEVILQMRKLKMNEHEILTLASIIEGESNISSEFGLISGVYHNRLKRRIKLQADPTIQYLLRKKKRHNKIYFKDLEIDSPFNTYKYSGLPPAPINYPGKEAIMAALFPVKHDYLFFVADGTGGHKFAKSLSMHQKNVRGYRQWRKNNR